MKSKKAIQRWSILKDEIEGIIETVGIKASETFEEEATS